MKRKSNGNVPNWQAKRDKVHGRDRWHCVICNTDKELECHHIVFRSQGGGNENSNLITLCHDCHKALHDGYLTEAMIRRGFKRTPDITKFLARYILDKLWKCYI